MNKSFEHLPKGKRKKILLICDDIRVHSGIATVAKEIVIHTAHHFNWVNVAGAINHPDKGKKLDSHIHNDFDRIATRTQESVYVRRGSMKVLLFTEKMEFLQEYVLYEGDLAVFAYGGHGYEILENDTQIIESKNGPFLDVNLDKTKFSK